MMPIDICSLLEKNLEQQSISQPPKFICTSVGEIKECAVVREGNFWSWLLYDSDLSQLVDKI